jgi:hypothetical protein
MELTAVCSYQEFELQDNEDALVNYVVLKRTLTDQIISLFESLIPNNFTQVSSACLSLPFISLFLFLCLSPPLLSPPPSSPFLPSPPLPSPLLSSPFLPSPPHASPLLSPPLLFIDSLELCDSKYYQCHCDFIHLRDCNCL